MTMLPDEYVDGLYAEDTQLKATAEGIRERGMPEISVAPGYGRLLTMLVRMSGSKQILEIGALGGYSGICLARGLGAEGRLISLELLPEYADVAMEHMRQAGLGDKVQYRIGEALGHLEKLGAEGATFDFFFIDADKENYPNYLDWAIRLANPGAVIVGDNVLLRGRTTDPLKQGPSVLAMREFNKRMASDPRLESTILPAYDGLAIARVKDSAAAKV
ncbi:methyltransferase [Paenibacillus swuensis]|uniref:Methyltransferase n=1 Tax=Paenibacillus swuensis TaxID=1178515 RepID=A0A172TMR4_9BACL|nr:O-methyltransferase [Paenibacillus swuensis]ANE48318.1 methyltransferase [Paenibacillus swuensis]